MQKQTNIETYISKNIGTIKWEIQENKIYLSSFLVNLLALPTMNKEQSYGDWCALNHPDGEKEGQIFLEMYVTEEKNYPNSRSRKLCRDGSYRWFSTAGEITKFDQESNPQIFHGTCLDLTLFDNLFSEFTNSKTIMIEIRKLKKNLKTKFSFDEINTEILKSFSAILSTPDCSFLLLEKKYENKINYLNNLKNSKVYEYNIFESDLVKNNFIDEILDRKISETQSIDGRHFLGIYYFLPFSADGLILIERDHAFNENVLELLDPIIMEAKHTIIDLKTKESINNVNKLVDFFFEKIPVEVAMFDKNMCYLFASIEWKKQRKLDLSTDFRGQSYYNIFPSFPPEWKEIHKRAFLGENISVSKQFMPNYFGEEAWVEYILRPWHNLSGEIDGLIIYSRNITDKIVAENLLENNIIELNRSNRELERFAHVCSHDLKEPLRSVSNFASLLFKESGEQLNETSEQYIKHILHNISRMDALIRDILYYARISNSLTEDQKVIINMNKVLNDVIKSLDKQIFDTNTHFNIEMLPEICGYHIQIFQLFLNLINNAIKYRSREHCIIDIFSIDKDKYWEFHVKDNGIGIEEEFYNVIFEFSKRLHSKDKYEGSGIGLTSCRKIVDNHKGTIGVTSKKGIGSDFYFTIPKTSSN